MSEEQNSAEAVPTVRRYALHLWALAAFAVSQPIYEMTRGNDGFLQTHQATRLDLVVFALVFSVLLPALPIGLFALAYRIKAGLGMAVFYTVFLLYVVMLALPLYDKYLVHDYFFSYLAASATGLLLTLAYRAKAALRQYCSVLAIGIPAFPLTFVLFASLASNESTAPEIVPEIAPELKARVDKNLVLIIFDELPLVSLLDADLQIDATRFPQLAALAEGATLYRNAGSVSDSTYEGAVPAIVSGLYPDAYEAGKSRRVLSVFNVFDARYTHNISEPLTAFSAGLDNLDEATTEKRLGLLLTDTTALFIVRLVPAIKSRLIQANTWKGILNRKGLGKTLGKMVVTWQEANADTLNHWPEFLDGIQPDRPLFAFNHLVFPHIPWRYLADGTQYPTVFDLIMNIREPFVMTYQWQQHLLQAGLADTMVGELVARLKETGQYDDTLLILVADHGCAFYTDGNHRKLNAQNYPDLVPIPLLVKYPGQTEGVTDDRMVQTIDLFPTVRHVLGLPDDPALPGRSLRRPDPGPGERRVFAQNLVADTTMVSVPADLLPDVRRRVADKNLAFTPGPLPAWRGPHEDLRDAAVTDLNVTARVPLKVVFQPNLAPYQPRIPVAPVAIPLTATFHLDHLKGRAVRYVAVAHDGRIVTYAPIHFQSAQNLTTNFFLPLRFADMPGAAFSYYLIEGEGEARAVTALVPERREGP